MESFGDARLDPLTGQPIQVRDVPADFLLERALDGGLGRLEAQLARFITFVDEGRVELGANQSQLCDAFRWQRSGDEIQIHLVEPRGREGEDEYDITLAEKLHSPLAPRDDRVVETRRIRDLEV